MKAPLEAVAKIVGLPGGCCPALCYYATKLPLAVGRGASHVQPWAYGDYLLLPEDSVAHMHLLISFEPQSRTYELLVNGPGTRVDGYDYARGAVVRLGSGSCVRIGQHEFCVLLPQQTIGAPRPRPLPLPALPGAGGPELPPLPLVAIAVQALREAPGGILSLGEIEQFIKRAYPAVRVSRNDASKWRIELEAELRSRPAVCEPRQRTADQAGGGTAWALRETAAAAALRKS